MSSSSALNTLLGSTSASSGIDITSLLQTALGASSSGIDVTAAVNAAVAAARAPENAWQAQITTLQSQSSALNQFEAQTSNLQNDLVSLNNFIGPLAARAANSSNATVVTASVAAGSSVGNHSITVSSMASTAAWASAAVETGSTILGGGSFTITPTVGAATSFSTDGTTLSALATQINQAGLGVTANVVTDVSGARLAITSNSSGLASNFSVASSSDSVQFTQAATGKDASLLVDGIQIDSASNSVSGVLPGVTLNLLNAAPGTNVTLSIGPDLSQSTAAINQFVSDFNTIIKGLNSQFTFTGSSEGVLAGDSTIRSLQSDLLGSLSYTAPGTAAISSLASLGISVANDGTLTVNSATLSQNLQANFSDVQNFFQGDAFNGFASALQKQLSTFSSPANGAFTVDLQSIGNQTSDLQNDIDNFETNYVVPLQARLKDDYSQAEILLQQLPSQLNQINTMLGVNTNNNH